MATNIIEGMFSTPEDIKRRRIEDLMKRQQSIGQMGGSMNQLLGQVAAQGGVTGSMMAEGLGGMFGLKSAEEAKAAQLNQMANAADLETSAGITAFAKQLNNMGMTKEAIMMLEKRDSVLDRERRMSAEDEKSALDKAMREGKIREGVPRRVERIRLDSKGNPVIGPNGLPQTETVLEKTYERWDESQMKWTPTEGPAATTSTTSGYMADWGKMYKTGGSTKPNGTPDFATNKPKTGTGAPALSNRDAATQQAMVQAYADYIKNLPAGSVPMEMDAWFKSQQ